MADESAAPASLNFEKLKAKLRELFELDKADLDFGIYRILRSRHAEITEFLDRHLEKTVRGALQSHSSLQQTQVKEELRKAEAAAEAAGIAPEQSPRVMDLRAKFAAGVDLNAVADEVYSHLLTFFSRYYQEGDFLGLHRSTVHGREKYMIPYNGEEVKLVWANMDQYYIKSSELLRDYAFRIRKADLTAGQLDLGDTPEESVIHLKLIEGDTEKDNRKPDGRTTRAFALDDDKPFEENDPTTLTLRFRYCEHASERNLQDKLNADAEKTLADILPLRWKSLLFAADSTYKGKPRSDTRTILQKHLRAYTARHQFDYFIHKDLGGFLRRELDFYIKNEVMQLDDIEHSSAPKAEEYLSKIRALRRCAMPVVRMLEQLENFQKKLWLKKKFVVETRYCMTLDRVPEALHPQICSSDAQWAEWEQLYALSEISSEVVNAKPRTLEFLRAQPNLMLDTKHYTREFTLQLLASIDDLDEKLDGVCFHSENFQALQLMQERYRKQVKCVYIDPPYNTASAPILYKNDYKYSSWATLVLDRIASSLPLLSLTGVKTVAIDDTEMADLTKILEQSMPNYRLSKVTVVHNPKGSITKDFNRTHEYALFLTPEAVGDCIERTLEENEVPRRMRRWGENSRRIERRLSFYPIYVKGGKVRRIGQVPEDDFHPSDKNVLVSNGETAVWPIDDEGIERRWNFGLDSIGDNLDRILVKEAEGKVDLFLTHELTVPKTVWSGGEYDAGNWGNSLLISILGQKRFDFPKSIHLVKQCISLVTKSSSNATVLDYFAGSGTTPHAVALLNEEDKGTRKYLAVEVGHHFEAVLVERLKKVAYSKNWTSGKPQNRDSGLSQAFKIVRLEGYEDTLNNLRLARTQEQEASLKKAEDRQRDEYLLSYFLDVESEGSASLLDMKQFRDPFAYRLHIATASAGETKETPVDLVETFNWLIGLKMKTIDAQKGFLTVTGEKRAGGRALIIRRTLGEDAKADNESLEKYLSKIAVNPADTEYEFIYVNGSHTLNDPHNKVHLIEEEFQRRMFDSENFEALG